MSKALRNQGFLIEGVGMGFEASVKFKHGRVFSARVISVQPIRVDRPRKEIETYIFYRVGAVPPF
jgi:hypothetical protein